MIFLPQACSLWLPAHWNLHLVRLTLPFPASLADFPVVYASGMAGIAGPSPDELADDLEPLFDAIVKEVSPPAVQVHWGQGRRWLKAALWHVGLFFWRSVFAEAWQARSIWSDWLPSVLCETFPDMPACLSSLCPFLPRFCAACRWMLLCSSWSPTWTLTSTRAALQSGACRVARCARAMQLCSPSRVSSFCGRLRGLDWLVDPQVGNRQSWRCSAARAGSPCVTVHPACSCRRREASDRAHLRAVCV